jgi:hypothetical protein
MKEHLWSTLGAQPYVYDTISTSETIRLLRLDNENNGIISGHLLTTTFADAPPYFALSYCWGMHKKGVAILCDGRKLRVTPNLAQALRRLQGLSNEASEWDLVSKWFWIDQICINQRNTDERSDQVKRMRSIYAKAIRTLIWLGPAYGSCHLAWNLVDQIHDVFRKENPDATYLSDIRLRLYSSSYHAGCGLPNWDDDLWKHLRRILQAPWFRRVWVIQEVALSQQDPIFLHGNHVYPWSRLGWASSWLRRVGFVRLDHIPNQIHNVDTISNLRRSQVRWSLGAILMATSGKFNATDPRDKIFGLLGLAAETEHELSWPVALLPDYQRDVAQVYLEAAKFLINEYQNLAILSRTIPHLNRITWSSTPKSTPVVDSWVPNWNVLTEPNQPRGLYWTTYHSGGGGADLGFPVHYNAAAGLPTSITPTADQRILHIRGLRVDTVISTSSFGDAITMLLQDYNAPRRTLKDFKLLSKSEGKTQLVRFSLILASAMRKPLFLRYWYLAVEKCEGMTPADLVDIFIKCTTGDQFHLAGSNSEQIRKDGCAYLLSQLQTVRERKRVFCSLSLPVSLGQASSRPRLTDANDCVPSGKQSPYLKALQDHATGGDPGAYVSLARNYCLNRRFFITLHGRLGIGPRWTKKGDLVCVLFGGGVPYILCPKGRRYIFIGESYVHGLMEGQAIDAWRKGELKDEMFRLR